MSKHNGIDFADSDVFNPGEFADESLAPFLVHHEGKALAVVFAVDVDSVKDELAYAKKLEQFRIADEAVDSMTDNEAVDALDSLLVDGRYRQTENWKFGYFDLSQVTFERMPRPALSLVALMGDKVGEIKFSDSDVLNLGDYNPPNLGQSYGVKLYLLHDAGFTQAIVFARSLQDAIDEAVDGDKLEQFKIGESELADYAIDTDSPTCSFLGNAGEPFDIDNLDAVELPAPAYSFCKLFDAQQPAPTGWDKV